MNADKIKIKTPMDRVKEALNKSNSKTSLFLRKQESSRALSFFHLFGSSLFIGVHRRSSAVNSSSGP